MILENMFPGGARLLLCAEAIMTIKSELSLSKGPRVSKNKTASFFKVFLAVNSAFLAYGILNLIFNNLYFAVLFAHLLFGVFAAAPLLFIKKGGYYILTVNFIFFILTLPAAVVMILFGETMNPNAFFALFNTDASEAAEFIANYAYKIPFFFLYSAAAVVPSILFRRAGIYTEKRVKYLSVLLIPLFIFLLWANQFRNTVFQRTAKAYLSYRGELERLSNLRKSADNHVEFEYIGAEYNLIFVIGESASALHMGAYGYTRDTTPFTDKIPFIRLTGVTPDAHTVPAVLKMFNAYDEDNGSLQNILTAAGYETHWISNQPTLGPGDTPIQTLVSKVKYRKHIMRGQYDGKLIPLVEEALAGTEKKAIFVHLVGSHTGYSRRCPAEYRFFKDKEGLSGFALKHYREVNHYDNSVRYTDFLIAELAAIAGKNNAFLIYIADHGEEVFDRSNFSGHTNGLISRYMSDVPFFILPPKDCKKDLTLYYERKEPVQTTNATYLTEDLLEIRPKGFSDTPHPLSYYDADKIISGGKRHTDLTK
jgi:heptose-I-phosphate ethanolaminephosphotransferase